MSSPNKSCELDPLPTVLLKSCLDTLLKPITDIINASLCSGLFPDDFKHAHVNPLLKKTSLSKEDLNSYIPVSNLSFISKILEKVVAKRLRSHVSSNCLSNVSQSAYKEFHSTETALLKVHNDVTLNIVKGKVTALTLLDLSAAFDTIDHGILIKRLSLWYGISGTALNWFLSYLTGRHQTIKIANCFSAALPTPCGVPQGSFLGPLLFTLYTTPLSSVIQNHNLDHHLYADDTQIYISLATSDTNRSLNQLSDCLQDIFLWMTESKLKLNADKIEFFIIGTPKQCGKLDGFFPTCILNQTITPAASAIWESLLIRISTLDNIFLKRVVAVFIIYMIFAVFAGICHFMSLKLLQQLLLAADLITAIPAFIILLSRILQNFNVSKIVWLG